MTIFNQWVRNVSVALAVTGFVMMGVIIKQIQAETQREIPEPLIPAPKKPFQQNLAGTGIIEALSENVEIGVPVQGIVQEVYVNANASVKAGDPLFKLDDREILAQMPGLQASVKVALANLSVAQANLARVEDLLNRIRQVTDRRAVSVDEVKSREMDVAVALAQVQAAEAQVLAAESGVKQAELLMERLTVRAPRDAQVLQVDIRAGEYASTTGSRVAMTLGNLERLQVRVDIDEQNASRVPLGAKAIAYIKGDSQNPIPLEFVRIEPLVIPKVSLTGASTERVDTRVLQVIYRFGEITEKPIYVGQQVDVMIEITQ